jgi:hypothetical protein
VWKEHLYFVVPYAECVLLVLAAQTVLCWHGLLGTAGLRLLLHPFSMQITRLYVQARTY